MESFAHGELGGASFVARVEADAGVKKGDRIQVAFATVHLFDAESGASLRAAGS
jgi:sn-glycerol 3-phosphate transport system ATP-binding protein/multiple sugar transport system ATP-binding protein